MSGDKPAKGLLQEDCERLKKLVDALAEGLFDAQDKVIDELYCKGLAAKDIESRLVRLAQEQITRKRGELSFAGTENPKQFVIQITGKLVERDQNHIKIAWFGGDDFDVAVSDTIGFEDLTPGNWFKAVIVRMSNGFVLQALLLQTSKPPEAMSEEELAKVYSQLPAADLDPAD